MKTESMKAMQELIINAENECMDEKFVETLKKELLRIVRIETPTCNGSKFNLYNYTTNKDKDRPWFAGIYHDGGFKVATTSHILAAMKIDYPAEMEGKILLKNGEFAAGKFPEWRCVIPSTDKMEPHTIDFDAVKRFEHESNTERKLGTDIRIDYIVKVGGCCFKLDYMMKFIAFMKEIGTDTMWTRISETVNYSGYSKPIYHPAYCGNDKGQCVMMPSIDIEEENFGILERA